MANSKGKCSACKKYFPRDDLRFTPAGKFCSPLCMQDYAAKNVSKLIAKGKQERRRETAVMKASMLDKDLSHQKKITQQVFNKFIRLRDGSHCITCNKKVNRQIHCGHFKTVGARPDLRYHPFNAASQCSICNNHLSGNIGEYMPNLLKKLGREDFESIQKNRGLKYTIEDLKIIRSYYQRLIKHLESRLVEFAA